MFAPARKIPSVGIPAVPTNSGSQTLRKRERKKHYFLHQNMSKNAIKTFLLSVKNFYTGFLGLLAK
jgi:hypothetical protein